MVDMRVLELRIHGIANPPPAEVLCTPEEEVGPKEGDGLGSFWQIKRRASVPSRPSRTKTKPAVETTAEAYSWGNQARSGGSRLVLIGRGFVHLGWLLVLPFGLCNLAYWARRDIKGLDESPQFWAAGDGGVLVRVFALLQTLLYMVGLLTVSVHLFGLQCFRSIEGPTPKTCAAMPGSLDLIGGWSSTARAAFFSIAAIGVILLVYIMGLRARGMFNGNQAFDDLPKGRRVRIAEQGDFEAAPPRPPHLASVDFWKRSRVGQASERSHLAAAFALTLTLLASDAALGSLSWSQFVAGLPGRALSIPGAAFPLLMSVAGALLLLGSVIMTAAAGFSGKLWSSTNKRRCATGILVFSVLAYAIWLVWALSVARDDVVGAGEFSGDNHLRGITITPTVIVAICALIAASSLSWGYVWRSRLVNWVILPLAIVSAVLSAFSAVENLDWMSPVFGFATAALVGTAIVVGVLPFRDSRTRAVRRYSGWHGNGACVALLLALLSSLVITSVLVLGAHAWITNQGSTLTDGIWRAVERPDNDAIARPDFYELFGALILALLLTFTLVLVVMTVAAHLRLPALSLPGPEYDPDLGGVHRLVDDGTWVPAPGPHSSGAPQAVPKHKYPPNERDPIDRRRAVGYARRVAALVQRGEPLLGVLAILTALALMPMTIPSFGAWLQSFAPETWFTLGTVGGGALGLLGLTSTAWVVTNAMTSNERPLGLIWDIICFFPRAGHPFTPPCYAERAVPEVTKRVERHFLESGDAGRVILSAHSMGATIAIASIFELYARDRWDVLERVALLTHGVQLRPYYSRFFPEIFGGNVLGISGTLGPSLLGADPWRQQVVNDHDTLASPPQIDGGVVSVAQILTNIGGSAGNSAGPRWRSLWRRTDYLGFPVTSFWSNDWGDGNENPVDRGATERSPRSYTWAIARHSDYVSTPQYWKARDELIEMLKNARTSATE